MVLALFFSIYIFLYLLRIHLWVKKKPLSMYAWIKNVIMLGFKNHPQMVFLNIKLKDLLPSPEA